MKPTDYEHVQYLTFINILWLVMVVIKQLTAMEYICIYSYYICFYLHLSSVLRLSTSIVGKWPGACPRHSGTRWRRNCRGNAAGGAVGAVGAGET